MLNVGNQIHNFISSSVSGTVINFGFGSDFLTSYGSGSGPLVKKLRSYGFGSGFTTLFFFLPVDLLLLMYIVTSHSLP
jgi:hypothetical protein